MLSCKASSSTKWLGGQPKEMKGKKQAANWRRFVFGKEEMCQYKGLEVTVQKQKCK